MAEQSIGMATGTGAGFGDGNVGSGYASSRMTAMETKTLSDGVLQVGNVFAMTGVGTGTLTIQDGAAVVGGYFYENTSSAAIVISTLANKTYNVVLLVHANTGTLAVARCVAGTTLAAYTVRLAVYDGTPAVPYLQLGTIVVSGASITTITPDYSMYGTTTQLPYQNWAQLSGGTATLTATNTAYDITNYSLGDTSGERIFGTNLTTGVITVRRAGLYLINTFVNFTNATTGTRTTLLKVGGTIVQRNMMPPGASNAYSTSSFMVVLAANDTVNIAANTITTAAQNVTDCIFTISRA